MLNQQTPTDAPLASTPVDSLNPDPILTKLDSIEARLEQTQKCTELLVDKLNRYREALELVVAAGRPHRRLFDDELCDCQGCRAYDAAERALQ